MTSDSAGTAGEPHAHAVPARALSELVVDRGGPRGVFVLVRHSLRADPDNDRPGFAAPLTVEGVRLAEATGALLEEIPARLLSSPSPRCIATAQALARGAGAIAEPRVSPVRELSEPHAFAADMDVAGPYFVRHGARGWVRGVLAGPAAVGAREAGLGTARILAAVRAEAGTHAGITLAVTHDTVLATVLHALTGATDVSEALWPRMMEGVLIWWAGDVLHYRWRDRAGTWRAPAAGTGNAP